MLKRETILLLGNGNLTNTLFVVSGNISGSLRNLLYLVLPKIESSQSEEALLALTVHVCELNQGVWRRTQQAPEWTIG